MPLTRRFGQVTAQPRAFLLTIATKDGNLLVGNENLILLIGSQPGHREENRPVRMAPLPAEEWDDDVRRALSVMLPAERLNPEGAGTALSTLARHPALTKAFLRFSNHLLFRSTLDPQMRELAILRIAHRKQCEYEWAHHALIGKAEGLTDEQIAGSASGEGTTPLDQLVLDAVDELDGQAKISDVTWAALCEHLSERQRMDLVFTIGGYGLMAVAYNTFGIAPESGH